MPHNFGWLAGTILVGTAVITATVLLVDRWLVKLADEDKPRIRRPLRVRKIKKRHYEPPAPKLYIVNPNKEGAENE